ncbi:MAG: hypothetical protein CMI74_04415 [Candidatus Pelagibacter sp.]|nr:hypothetical protein [Candidatus Pelagibacter sp.]|tara:strand:- start:3556 stop:4776 length:1221 start_codon:yes stop_codon:yes gene_type:complete
MYDMVITSLPGMDRDKPAPGPAFLKGYLETKGFKIKVIDGNQLDTLDNIHKEISQYKFKWLGISVFSYLQKDDALKLGEKYDNVLFGGSGVDVFWPRKHFVVGEGEYALVEFLNGNLDYPGINGNPPQQIENIEDLPPPDYSDVMCKHDYDTAIISGSRGCVRKCTFCDVMTIWPKYRWKSGKKIADDMHEVAEKTGLKKIGFSDSLVNGSMKHFRDMCKELASRDKKVQWNGQFIVRGAKTFSSEDFDNLANSGCNGLTMGIESGSEKVRDHMRKKFSNEDIDYFMKNLGDRKIKMKMLLIVGYPTETEEDFEETLQLLRRYKKYAKYISVSPHMMLTYKNTPLDFDHRDLYDTEGFHWKNDISNYNIRLVRFKKVFEVGQQMGYKFNKHALDKIEKFDKLQYQS